MNLICNLCNKPFSLKNQTTRKYCYQCSPSFTKTDKKSHIFRQNTFRRAMKLQGIQLLGGKCQRCGYYKCVAALEFHHTNPEEKEFHFSNSYLSWTRYKKELQKCILLCSNCHAEVHYKRVQ